MRVITKGHRYELAHRGGDGTTTVQFVGREPGLQCEGVLTQEILRMLIDRTRYCNNCQPHPNNERIIYHFRMALMLHEARALERKVQKGELAVEYVDVGEDGHFALTQTPDVSENSTRTLDPYTPEWDRTCNHTFVEPPPPAGRWGPTPTERTNAGMVVDGYCDVHDSCGLGPINARDGQWRREAADLWRWWYWDTDPRPMEPRDIA